MNPHKRGLGVYIKSNGDFPQYLCVDFLLTGEQKTTKFRLISYLENKGKTRVRKSYSCYEYVLKDPPKTPNSKIIRSDFKFILGVDEPILRIWKSKLDIT